MIQEGKGPILRRIDEAHFLNPFLAVFNVGFRSKRDHDYRLLIHFLYYLGLDVIPSFYEVDFDFLMRWLRNLDVGLDRREVLVGLAFGNMRWFIASDANFRALMEVVDSLPNGNADCLVIY
jgi:hypothetical protein